MKFLLLDLDGTIIQTKSGDTFPKDENDWKFKARTLEKIKRYYKDNYKIIIVTNQRGINLGFVNPIQFALKLQDIKWGIQRYIMGFNSYSDLELIPSHNIATYVGLTDEECKPNVDGFLEFIERNNTYEIDWTESLMVGDASSSNSFSDSDYQFANNLGCQYMDVEDFLNH